MIDSFIEEHLKKMKTYDEQKKGFEQQSITFL